MVVDAVFWRRLDGPGSDACRLSQGADGVRIEGAANWIHGGEAASLSYRVDCGTDWRTRYGAVQGWVGTRDIDLRIEVGPDGDWTLNGSDMPQLHGMVDLDLGFTPATNILPIRRLSPRGGIAADAPAAWLDLSDWSLKVLRQTYRRIDETAYAYEAPVFDYADTLTVRPSGMVLDYPGLWTGGSPPA